LKNKICLILDLDGVLMTNPFWKADRIHLDGYSEFNDSRPFPQLIIHKHVTTYDCELETLAGLLTQNQIQ